MKDLKIKSIAENNMYSDLEVIDNDLAIIDGRDELEQFIKIKILTIMGEWFLDNTMGVDYYEYVWNDLPNKDDIDTEFQRVILSIDGVTELIEYNSEIISGQRLMNINFSVNTVYGEITIDERVRI